MPKYLKRRGLAWMRSRNCDASERRGWNRDAAISSFSFIVIVYSFWLRLGVGLNCVSLGARPKDYANGNHGRQMISEHRRWFPQTPFYAAQEGKYCFRVRIKGHIAKNMPPNSPDIREKENAPPVGVGNKHLDFKSKWGRSFMRFGPKDHPHIP